MPKPQPIDYADASPDVRAVYDDIKTSRKVEDVNNFWKYLANDPVLLRRTWTSVKEVMTPGALDQVRLSSAGSLAKYFQKLLTSSTLRLVLMSS